MQNQLTRLYKSFLALASAPSGLDARMSCPLLVGIGERWPQSQRRLLIVGQETLGWDFVPGDYYPWPHPPLKSFIDFQSYEGAVDAVVQGYIDFAFARHQPANYRSPFWRAFRQLLDRANSDGAGDVLWTNLLRCSIDGGSVIHSCHPAEVEAILTFQDGLLRQEIHLLQPTTVLFFTGPLYDAALQAEFPGTEFVPIEEYCPRQLAQIVAPRLPPASFRTYHPGYLARSSERWSWLDKIPIASTGAIAERTRIDRESKANHDLILWLGEPTGIWRKG